MLVTCDLRQAAARPFPESVRKTTTHRSLASLLTAHFAPYVLSLLNLDLVLFRDET